MTFRPSLAFLLAAPLATLQMGCTGVVLQDKADAGAPHAGDAGTDAGVDAPSPVCGPCGKVGPPIEAGGQDVATSAEAAIPSAPAVVMFAGYGEAPLQDTWLWAGSTWSEPGLPGGVAPGIRSDQSMIGFQGKVLLFGGEPLGQGWDADTWVWDASGWTQLRVTGPSAREGAALAVLGDKLILYGGQGAGGGFLSDTWEWDGSVWTELSVTGPGGRYGHSMATLGSNVVLFGGVASFLDTWTFDGSSWTQVTTVGPTGNPAGPANSRTFQTMATLGDRVILFGGEQDANYILNDTWSWDGSAWTQIVTPTAPPERFHAGMTTFQGKLFLFGGAGAIPQEPGFLGDTWTFDGTSWTSVSADGPSPRYAYALASWGAP